MKDNFDKLQSIAQILSLLAIPVLVAIFGWKIQEEMKEKEVRRDFVQIAISVLSSPQGMDDGKAQLRHWASRILASMSPVPFDDGEFKALLIAENGKALRAALRCNPRKVEAPEWAAQKLKKDDDLETKVRYLLAEREQRIGYEIQLEAAVASCQ